VLSRPTTAQIAEQVGLRTRSTTPFYDLVIVGGGPAGLAAAVYGASEGLHVAIIECDAPGGQAGTSSHIDNYLGFPAGVSGAELSRRALMQARRFGAEMIRTRICTSWAARIRRDRARCSWPSTRARSRCCAGVHR